MDIGAWLRGLGLGHYESASRDGEIEADVLPDLTDADLEKLGLPLGAQACFLQAIDVARTQEARLLELRAATDLARLWRDNGSPNDPRALLEPILAAIEGGEATRDVRAARALLAEVG
jgi:hypothetical protein